MQKFENQLKCHPAFLLPEVEESQLEQCGRISILDSHQAEQGIYIYKNEDAHEYEVRIHKHSPADVYRLPVSIGISSKRYVANDKFASFFFRTFHSACKFIASLAESNPDALIRPALQKS